MKNIANKKFGLLTAIRPHHKNNQQNWCWLCICDCGVKHVVSGYSLRIGDSKSCGCLSREIASQTMRKIGIRFGHKNNNYKHGHTVGYKETTTYNSWERMLERCKNPNHDAYKYYGGRGVKVCERWRNSFNSFFIHCSQGKVNPIFFLNIISLGNKSPNESINNFLGITGYLNLSSIPKTYSINL